MPPSAPFRSLAGKARKLASVFASNAAGTVLGQLVMLVAIPAQLHHLGAAQFGLLVLFNSFVAAGALTDAGIGPTVQRFVARTDRHPKALEHVIASSLTVILIISAAITVLGLAGMQVYVLAKGAAPVAGSVHPLTLAALVAAAVSASMVSGLGLNILRGLRHYRVFALCESIHRVVLPLLSTLVAVLTRDAKAVLLTVCLWTLASALATLWYAGRRAGVPIHMTRNLRYFRRSMFNFSRWVWAQAVFAYAGSQADRLVVAAAMSLSALATYAIAVSAANALLAVMTAGGAFLLPEAASRMSDRAWLSRSFVRFTMLFSGASALAIVCFLPIARPVLELWVGVAAAGQILPILLPLLWTISNAAASAPGNHILNAMGHSKFAAIAGAIANTLVLASMIIGGAMFGLWGVVGAKLMSLPFGFCIRATTAHRIFKMPHPISTAIRMLWPTLVGVLVVLPLSWYLMIRN